MRAGTRLASPGFTVQRGRYGAARGLMAPFCPRRFAPAFFLVALAAVLLTGCGGSASGGSATLLRWTDETPAWSPDGRQIAFASNRANPKSTIDHLYLMDRRGGHIRRLTHDRVDAREPSFSPNGKWIVYAANVLDRSNTYTDASTVETISANGTIKRTLTGMSGDVEQPAWSPNGRWIAFMDTVWNGNKGIYHTDLYIVRPDGSGLRKLAINVDGWAFAWSPDSKEIAVAGDGRLLQIHQNARRPIRLANGNPIVITDIAWSPDGLRIAFVRGQITFDGSGDIRPRALWIRDLRSGRTFRLRGVVDSQSLGSFAVTITWVSAGRPRLAVFGNGKTYLLSPNGHIGRSWPTYAEFSNGSASRDGKGLLFVDGPNGSYLSAIYLASVTGHTYRQLTQTPSGLPTVSRNAGAPSE
jgi:dipeptidyl aminopeptidase/acylaminoacyl peptidase